MIKQTWEWIKSVFAKKNKMNCPDGLDIDVGLNGLDIWQEGQARITTNTTGTFIRCGNSEIEIRQNSIKITATEVEINGQRF